MSAAETVGMVVGALGAVGSISAVLVGLGRVLKQLDTISADHKEARAESKTQHEETRREITGLREARVANEAAADRLRSDVTALQKSVSDMSEKISQSILPVSNQVTQAQNGINELRDLIETRDRAVRDLIDSRDRAQNEARHAQSNTFASVVASIVHAEIDRAAATGSRPKTRR